MSLPYPIHDSDRTHPKPPAAKEQGLKFLSGLAQDLSTNPAAIEAHVLVDVEAAHYRLLLGDTDGTQKAIQDNEKRLDTLDKVDHAVHASFYRVSADLHKVCDDALLVVGKKLTPYRFPPRPRQNIPSFTTLRFFSWRASTSTQTSLLNNLSNEPMTWPSQLSLVKPSTTSASLYGCVVVSCSCRLLISV